MLDEFKPNLPRFKHKSQPLKKPSMRARASDWRTYKTAFLTMALAGMGACQSTQLTPFSETNGPLAGAEFCQAARAIYYSRHDTPPTIAQIKEHNAVGVALKCGWTTKAQLVAAKGAK